MVEDVAVFESEDLAESLNSTLIDEKANGNYCSRQSCCNQTFNSCRRRDCPNNPNNDPFEYCLCVGYNACQCKRRCDQAGRRYWACGQCTCYCYDNQNEHPNWRTY